MSNFEQLVSGLKQRHATEISDLQHLLDKQSVQIESLDAEAHSLKSSSRHVTHAAQFAQEQLSITEKKLTAARTEVTMTGSQCADLHEKLYESDTKLQAAATAAKHAADQNVNLQQQITALKHKLAASSDEQDILQLQKLLEQAHHQVATLQQQSQTGMMSANLRKSFFALPVHWY